VSSESTGRLITVVLADDHEIVRNGIGLVLEAQPDIRVVAEAADAETAVRYTLGHKPTVLVLDLSMPGGSGLEAISKAREASPETDVIVLTMQNEPAFARQALQGGARGYVIKHAAASELVTAIRAVTGGDTYVTPSLGARLAAEPEDPVPDELTPREVEVLGLLARGYTNPEIADQLTLSVRTIETHRANVQRKADCATRAELIAYAIDHDLVGH
jgi:two-component system response regulator NreC